MRRLFVLLALASFTLEFTRADVVIEAAPGFQVAWDGNDGDLFDATPPPDGAKAPDNLALAANGSVAIASGELAPELGIDTHLIENLNDGFYGNANSWIGGSTDSSPFFAGVNLGGRFEVTSVAWGRDNGNGAVDDSEPGTDACGGQCDDRWMGLYELQITTDEFVDENAQWTTVATFDFQASEDIEIGGSFTGFLRHEFAIADEAGDPVVATAVRVIVPTTGLGGGTAIDEFEVYGSPAGPLEGPAIEAAEGFVISWNGNDGLEFDEVPPPDGAVVPENLALAANGALPLGSSELGPELGIAYHLVANANDGFYGNGNSWISASDDGFPFVGINLGGNFEITSIAWGRDNGNGAVDDSVAGTDACGGQCDDRSLGLYTLQVTTVADPDADTPDEDWATVGTLDYPDSFDHLVGGAFTSYLRHEYRISLADGSPIPATGIRILVPAAGLGGGTAIDEIEVYDASIIPRLRTAEEGGQFPDDETNLAATGTPFAKDVISNGDLAPHQIAHLNDGVYGNANSWIGNSADSFAGISLGGEPVTVGSIAFGRDNTGGFNDRSLGTYTLQYTATPDPDETTPDEDWTTIGEIVYEEGSPAAPHLRHRINFDAVQATGLRLIAPGGAAIDEIEIYEDPIVIIPPPPAALVIESEPGYLISWDGNDGDHFDPTPPEDGGSVVPDNLALASNGTMPFGSGELGPELGLDYHFIANVNDGEYGNNRSWIGGGADNPSFIGLDFGRSILLGGVAWGRDNGNGQWDDSEAGTDACEGQCDDRNGGLYRLQITNVANPDESTPDEDWVTVGTLNYRLNEDNEPGGGFTKHLRHQYEVTTADGAPLQATGLRLVVPSAAIAIDELEVYGPKGDPLLAVENGGLTASIVGATPQTFRLGLSNEGNTRTLELTEVTLDGPNVANFTLDAFPAGLDPGASGEFVIAFDPGGTVGRFLAELRVVSNDEFSPEQTFPIRVSVESANRLVAHYKMDETEGNQLIDSSGNQYHGAFMTNGDGTVTFGEDGLASGTAVRFTGDIAFAEIPAEAGLPSLETFSISMWVRYDEEDADTASTLFSKGAATGDPFALVATVGTSPSPLQFFSTGEPYEPSAPAVQTSTTHHVVAIHVDENGADAGATSLRIYVDGALVLENLSPNGFDDSSPSVFQIGATNGGFGMVGVVDDVQIYQKELSDEERVFLSENPGEVLPGDDIMPPPVSFMAEGVRLVQNGAEIAWGSEPGTSYFIEFSESMRADDWQPVSGAEEIVAGDGNRSTYVDQSAPGVLRRFYRIGVVPE